MKRKSIRSMFKNALTVDVIALAKRNGINPFVLLSKMLSLPINVVFNWSYPYSEDLYKAISATPNIESENIQITCLGDKVNNIYIVMDKYGLFNKIININL